MTCREKIPNLSKGQLPSRSYEGQTPEPSLALVPPSLLTADPARALGIPAPPCFLNSPRRSESPASVLVRQNSISGLDNRRSLLGRLPHHVLTEVSRARSPGSRPRQARSYRLTHLTLPALPRSPPKPTGKCSKAENLTAWNALADSPGDSLRPGSLPPSP